MLTIQDIENMVTESWKVAGWNGIRNIVVVDPATFQAIHEEVSSMSPHRAKISPSWIKYEADIGSIIIADQRHAMYVVAGGGG